MKKFQNISDVLDTLTKNQNYNHQIKGKRLKKQLKSLQDTIFQGIKFKSFQINQVAISIIIEIKGFIPDGQYLILRLDRQYPFNPPQLFYLSTNPTQKHQYSYCKDLLINILKDQLWGPSLTLPAFLQKLPNLAESISKKQKLKWSYHNQFQYAKSQLIYSGHHLFQIVEYKWEYKFLKMTKIKILSLTPTCFLIFEAVENNDDILKLDIWLNIEDIAEVKATPGKKNYQLEIHYLYQGKQEIMYLGGKPNDLNTILDTLNPIQMIERKVKNYQKSGVTDYTDAIQNYTALIQHYSLTNKTLSDQYMTSMKKLIESHYPIWLKYKPDKLVSDWFLGIGNLIQFYLYFFFFYNQSKIQYWIGHNFASQFFYTYPKNLIAIILSVYMSLYRFPVHLDTYLQITSKKHLREKLSSQQLQTFSFHSRKLPLKGVQLLEFQGKHIYAKCVCNSARGGKCQWKLIYTRKSDKGGQLGKKICWEENAVYYLKVDKSYFYHNHPPFSTFLPSDHPPIQYNCLWTMLTNMGFPAMKSYSYIADYGKQINVPGNLKLHRTEIDIFRDGLSFASWAKIAKSKYKAEILYYPQGNNRQPSIALVIPMKAIQICAWHGQVIGIKVINTKVVQTSKTCQYYKALLFYQFFPKWKNLIYMFAVYTQHNYKLVQIPSNSTYNSQMNITQKIQEEQQIKQKKIRIDINIYKLLSIFIKILGKKLKTFIIDLDQNIIDTIRYTIQKQNNKRYTTQNKLQFIIDPSHHYANIMKLNKKLCTKIVHKFMATSSEQQYSKIYKYYVDNQIKKSQSGLNILISTFDRNRQHFLPFLQTQPIFVGGWFDVSYIDNLRLELQLNNPIPIHSLSQLFDLSTLTLLQQLKTYQNRTSLLQNTYYQLVYPFSFFKQARNNMLKFAFLMLVKQTLKISVVNFVHEISIDNRHNIFQGEWKNQEKMRKQLGEGKQGRSILWGELERKESGKYMEEIEGRVMSQFSESLPSMVIMDENKNNQSSNRKNEKNKKYQELFNIQPLTLIKINTMLPPYLQVQDNGQLYICILLSMTQQQFTQSKKTTYISPKVHPIYYKSQYRCSCQYHTQKGIPCHHLLKICIRYQLPIYPYIENYLKFKDSRMEWKQIVHRMNGTDMPKVGKPKLSHRRSRKKCKPGQELFQGYYCQKQENN